MATACLYRDLLSDQRRQAALGLELIHSVRLTLSVLGKIVVGVT